MVFATAFRNLASVNNVGLESFKLTAQIQSPNVTDVLFYPGQSGTRGKSPIVVVLLFSKLHTFRLLIQIRGRCLS